MDAAVCSLADLVDVADLGRVEVVTEGEVLALDFPGEPGSFAKVWLSPGGVVLRAAGGSSGNVWRLEVLEESVASRGVLLRVEDVDPPPRWKAPLLGPK